MSRKVIQIATMPESFDPRGHGSVTAALYALCDDGTLWSLGDGSQWNDWMPVKPVPQESTATQKSAARS